MLISRSVFYCRQIPIKEEPIMILKQHTLNQLLIECYCIHLHFISGIRKVCFRKIDFLPCRVFYQETRQLNKTKLNTLYPKL